MVTIVWDESFRIIASRYPFVGIFDGIADPEDIEAIVELEQRTNDRIRDEVGDIALVGPGDRISGPGSTPIMAAFTHSRPSRFSDGTYGVYYAARALETAVAETVHHVERFYASTREPSADIDMRVYSAMISGSFDDLRSIDMGDPRLDPESYTVARNYASSVRLTSRSDGIVYPSVRDPERRACVACFRPKTVTACYSKSYMTYRWSGPRQRITETFKRESLDGT